MPMKRSIPDPHQLNNLVNNPKYASELNRHRKLLDGWLAKGDTGAGDEPEIELKMASHERWGIGVNAEYEAIRIDSDGDGLSDQWEAINNRDPKDGLLAFMFDCGGWQTEGWTAVGNVTNIAGRLGYLDFDLVDGRGGISRNQLKLATKDSKQIQVKLKLSNPAKLTFKINGQENGKFDLAKSDEFVVLSLRQNEIPEKTIESLQIEFVAVPKTTVEIDWIKYQ